MLTPPSANLWSDLPLPDGIASRSIDLNTLTRKETCTWLASEILLLSGRLLTGRDAAHKRIDEMLSRGEPLPVDLRDRMVYCVWPVDPVRDEVVGPYGPTTSARMDMFAERMLASTSLLRMIGKAERGPDAIGAIVKNGCVYLAATGDAAYLISQALRSARVLAFGDLDMEAIH